MPQGSVLFEHPEIEVSESNTSAGNRFRSCHSGFSIVELLAVILIIGVLGASGISFYSGIAYDTRLKTLADELEGFFSTCKSRALLRGIPVKLSLRRNVLFITESPNIKIELPEIERAESLLNGITFIATQTFDQSGRELRILKFNADFSGNRQVEVSSEFFPESVRVKVEKRGLSGG